MQKTIDFEQIQELFSEIQSLYSNLKDSLANGYSQLEDIHRIKKEFGDFWIPQNIQRRAKEIGEVKDALRR